MTEEWKDPKEKEYRPKKGKTLMEVFAKERKKEENWCNGICPHCKEECEK